MVRNSLLEFRGGDPNLYVLQMHLIKIGILKNKNPHDVCEDDKIFLISDDLEKYDYFVYSHDMKITMYKNHMA